LRQESEPLSLKDELLIWNNSCLYENSNLAHSNDGFQVMFDNGNVQRDKIRQELAALREEAISKFERRGYEVRGKTPAQIRSALRRRPKKKRSNTRAVS